MGHTSKEKLVDLKLVLEKIRAMEGIKEPKPGIFYFKSKPFLHFHDAEGKRWADAKDGDSWGKQIEIPFNSSKVAQEKFYKEVLRRYNVIISSGVKAAKFAKNQSK